MEFTLNNSVVDFEKKKTFFWTDLPALLLHLKDNEEWLTWYDADFILGKSYHSRMFN